jgi:exopolysaccharide biosynthesis predicted pyruvyltransferase EpsI
MTPLRSSDAEFPSAPGNARGGMLTHTHLHPETWNGSLISFLETFRANHVTVLHDRGNRGDGIAHLGGRRLLDSLGIKRREVHQENAPLDLIKGEVLLVHGGGAMCRANHSLVGVLERMSRNFQRIVILPATFDLECGAVRKFARAWDQRYTIFCRELVSYDALKEFGIDQRLLMLGHDLSLHADVSAWEKRPHAGSWGIFRQDAEASFGRLPPGIQSVDAARGSHREPERLLDFIARFSELHTDRCHAAIAAAMMGRRVVLYPNNFFKNQAIYEHSLAQFPNIVFARKQPFSFRQFVRATYWGKFRSVAIDEEVASITREQNAAEQMTRSSA